LKMRGGLGLLLLGLLCGAVQATYSELDTEIRNTYGAADFRSTQFSAMFIIFVGTFIVLVGGVMMATCVLYEIEPGKDSLVYRGSATRTKVE